jgi:hypothetical protein
MDYETGLHNQNDDDETYCATCGAPCTGDFCSTACEQSYGTCDDCGGPSRARRCQSCRGVE